MYTPADHDQVEKPFLPPEHSPPLPFRAEPTRPPSRTITVDSEQKLIITDIKDEGIEHYPSLGLSYQVLVDDKYVIHPNDVSTAYWSTGYSYTLTRDGCEKIRTEAKQELTATPTMFKLNISFAAWYGDEKVNEQIRFCSIPRNFV